ncbi:DUF3347 domain-containing protein [Mucilaginibacter sp. BJC16-A38]|uniref:DUF3347 domain-containing protein n=1 Tax=Mucilaginibacter phenanthrenivorans TaxID=1234842 RepID=UPI0021581A5C|nr:DUF3347 domain-containing protein [Mucilaginibacter phenanthrenivorans]MCR8561239.1 DUF3347 domain-containing protein [Mucilaginibacter phenanthrenivorans]
MKNLKVITLTIVLALCTILTNAKPAPAGFIDKITNAYLDVKNALISGDGNAVKLKAAELLKDLSTIPDKSLNPAQQAILQKYQTKLLFDSRHMSETTVIDHQREHFASLSQNMYSLLKGVKLNTATIYQEYCPMKKAYWLSESNEIKNPYFGSKMLDCGKVTETLAPAK